MEHSDSSIDLRSKLSDADIIDAAVNCGQYVGYEYPLGRLPKYRYATSPSTKVGTNG